MEAMGLKRGERLLLACVIAWLVLCAVLFVVAASISHAEVERIVAMDLQYTITNEGCMCMVAADNLKAPAIYHWSCSCGGWVAAEQEGHAGVTGHQVAVFRQWYKRMHQWHYGYAPKFERALRFWLKWLR